MKSISPKTLRLAAVLAGVSLAVMLLYPPLAGLAYSRRSLADGLSELCKQEKFEILRTEGYQEGQWVLVDLNDIIVHIFQEPVRELYRLEALWSGAEELPATAAEGKENN